MMRQKSLMARMVVPPFVWFISDPASLATLAHFFS